MLRNRGEKWCYWLFCPQRGNATYPRSTPKMRNPLSHYVAGHPYIMPFAAGLSALIHKSTAVPSGASHQPLCVPPKLHSLSLAGGKNSQKSAPLIFPVSDFGEVFSLCDPLCVPSPLHSLCDQGSLSSTAPSIHFSPQTTSLHLHNAASLPLVVQFCQPSDQFLGYTEWFYIYLAVLKG